MKLARPDVEYRLNDLQGMVYAACRLGAWCFSVQKKLFFTTSPHEQEYHMLLQSGGCLDAAMDKKDLPGLPTIMTGELGLGWIAEWVHLQNGGHLLVILGPMVLKNSSIEESLQRLDQKGMSQHLRRDYMKVLGDVPYVHSDSIKNFASMLHFTCYEENLSRDSIPYEAIGQVIKEKAKEAAKEMTMKQMKELLDQHNVKYSKKANKELLTKKVVPVLMATMCDDEPQAEPEAEAAVAEAKTA